MSSMSFLIISLLIINAVFFTKPNNVLCCVTRVILDQVYSSLFKLVSLDATPNKKVIRLPRSASSVAATDDLINQIIAWLLSQVTGILAACTLNSRQHNSKLKLS